MRAILGALALLIWSYGAGATVLPDNGTVSFYERSGSIEIDLIGTLPDFANLLPGGNMNPSNGSEEYIWAYFSLFDAQGQLVAPVPMPPDVFTAGPGIIALEEFNCADTCSGRAHWPFDHVPVLYDNLSPGPMILQISSESGGCPCGPIDYQLVANISPIPETSTWAMLLIGFAGIGFMAYRRKSKPAFMTAR